MEGRDFGKFEDDVFMAKTFFVFVQLWSISLCNNFFNTLHFYFRKHLRDMMYEEYQAM